MDKKSKFRRFRLSLLFAAIVFLIMFAATLLVVAGALVLDHFGLLNHEMTHRVPLFYFCVVSLVVGTVLAFVFSSKPLKPLREIMDATDRIAAGDYSVRLHLKRPEEFRQLSDKFNHMAEEIGSVEMLRSDFIGNFSHEFKTPIVSIRGFAKALKWDDLTDAERDEYINIIIDESERLSELSQNVLYLSKIEKQAILTNKKKYNVSEQIRQVIALLDHKISSKHLTLSFDGHEHEIEGNEEMLAQVWINLLDNAIKFSPENGRIEIRIKQNDTRLSVRITNQGEEITPEQKSRIFDKFYQADPSHSTSGNGLGLAIVKKIVDLHAGTISVLSSDKGSTFEIDL